MFEQTFARVSRSAERRRLARIEMLAERMRAAVPGGIEVEPVPEGVRLSGGDLRARFALDPALRWLTTVLR